MSYPITAGNGLLTTAHCAFSNNRIVMAVPGNITSEFSAGPDNLIRGGAIPITSATDTIFALDFDACEAVPVSAQSTDEALLIRLLEADERKVNS